MEKLVIYCDRCNVVVTEVVGNPKRVAIEHPTMRWAFDLCNSCIGPIHEYLEGGELNASESNIQNSKE